MAKLERCRKADLVLTANFFDVHVPLNVKKQELKELVFKGLSERVLFGEPAPEVGAEGEAGVPTPLHDFPVQNMNAEELKLTLRIREVEVRNRELEVEAMHLRLRALELEMGASVATRLAAVSLGKSPLPKPRARDSFDVHIALVPPSRESEVDSYFNAFERIAATLNWPKSVWPASI